MGSTVVEYQITELIHTIKTGHSETARGRAHQDLVGLIYGTLDKDLCYHFSGKLTAEGREEVLWKGLYNIGAKLHTFDPAKGKFLTWAKKVVRNAAIDEFRRNRDRTVDWDRIQDLLDGQFPSPEAQSLMLEIELESLVEQYFSDREPHYRAIFRYYLYGLTPKEIAVLVGWKTKKVQDLVSHIKASLRVYANQTK